MAGEEIELHVRHRGQIIMNIFQKDVNNQD